MIGTKVEPARGGEVWGGEFFRMPFLTVSGLVRSFDVTEVGDFDLEH